MKPIPLAHPFNCDGLLGFGYQFNAIQNESNELFGAYKDMFEIAISQINGLRLLIGIYLPFLLHIYASLSISPLLMTILILGAMQPDSITRTVRRCREIIHRVAGQLVQEKKKKVMKGEKEGSAYGGKDLLSLLRKSDWTSFAPNVFHSHPRYTAVKSNVATDLPPEQRISDEDILNNINTFMFAGSDTTSLALAWTFLLLAQNPSIQTRLRAELLALAPPSTKVLTPEETESFYDILANLPYLHNVSRESLRLIPPVHSSLRVATQDDDVPTSHPVHLQDGTELPAGTSVRVPKGSFVHIPIEAFNLDKGTWGEDAWQFK